MTNPSTICEHQTVARMTDCVDREAPRREIVTQETKVRSRISARRPGITAWQLIGGHCPLLTFLRSVLRIEM
jgi:hypothetical protein